MIPHKEICGDIFIKGKNNVVHCNRARIFATNLMINISAMCTKNFCPEGFIALTSAILKIQVCSRIEKEK